MLDILNLLIFIVIHTLVLGGRKILFWKNVLNLKKKEKTLEVFLDICKIIGMKFSFNSWRLQRVLEMG